MKNKIILTFLTFILAKPSTAQQISQNEFVEQVSCVVRKHQREFERQARRESLLSKSHYITPITTFGAVWAHLQQRTTEKTEKLVKIQYQSFKEIQQRVFQDATANLRLIYNSLPLLQHKKGILIEVFSRALSNFDSKKTIDRLGQEAEHLSSVEALKPLLQKIERYRNLEFAQTLLQDGIDLIVYDAYARDNNSSEYIKNLNTRLAQLRRHYDGPDYLFEQGIERREISFANDELRQLGENYTDNLKEKKRLFQEEIADDVFKNRKILLTVVERTETRLNQGFQKRLKKLERLKKLYHRSKKALLVATGVGLAVTAWRNLYPSNEMSEEEKALESYISQVLELETDQELINWYNELEKEELITKYLKTLKILSPTFFEECESE